MRHSQSTATRSVARAPRALIGLARVLARQAARDVVASDSGLARIAREETAPETRLATLDPPNEQRGSIR